MKKLLLLVMGICSAGASMAQFCGTFSRTEQLKQGHPEVARYEAELETQIQQQLAKMNLSRLARATSADSTIVVPVVVHVIHDYGAENVTDNQIFTMIGNLNDFYQLRNNTADIIPPFKKYIGKPNFLFKLATKDPNGNPTKGITRHYSYLTYGYDDEAKLSLWNPSSYLNIWVEDFIGQSAEETGGFVVAYAYLPSLAAALPFYDGVIVNSRFIGITGDGEGADIPHEVGHFFNLFHTFGPTNSPGNTCLSDEVDDTPPTGGQFGGCDVYASSCVIPYFMLYPSSVPAVDSLADYPDTANVQNIMNYADCKIMFTKGQVARMRAAAHTTIANRDSLITPFNAMVTGLNNPTPDLPPVADFSVENGSTPGLHVPTNATRYFLCTGSNFYFRNQSWNDTVSSLSWTFSNDASTPSVTATNPSAINNIITNKFSQSGWVSVSLTATSNAGSTTIKRDSTVYVADPTGIKPIGYFQEFNQGSGNDLNKWPIFNYFHNSNKWEVVDNVGYYDNTSIRYDGYDTRTGLATATGTPRGDFDDFFTPAFDLSALTSGNCNLNFMSAGTFVTSNSYDMHDTLQISYSTNCGTSWTVLKELTKSDLVSAGSSADPFTPAGGDQWKLNSFDIPAAARTNATFFRFRYKPGAFASGLGSGNNFYIDRINISNNPLGVNTLISGNEGIVLAPNPTQGNTSVFIREQDNGTAHLTITDITGKVVYSTTATLYGKDSKIDIPSSAIAAKGLYMVQVATSRQSFVQKLVVY